MMGDDIKLSVYKRSTVSSFLVTVDPRSVISCVTDHSGRFASFTTSLRVLAMGLSFFQSQATFDSPLRPSAEKTSDDFVHRTGSPNLRI